MNFNKNMTTVRFVAYGCGAQNKNTNMIKSSCFKPDHVSRINIPYSRSFFLPPDRVFDLIEKEIKKKETNRTPEQYIEVLERHGTVKRFENVYDWKPELKKVIPKIRLWHCQFQHSKRFYIKRHHNKIVIRGESHYNDDLGVYKPVMKKKTIVNVIPECIDKYRAVVKKLN